MKKCPFCAEEILDEAIKCKHCGEFLEKPPKEPWYFKTWAIVTGFLTVGPFVLPLVWFHPKYSRTKKIIITVVALVVTYYLYVYMMETMQSLNEYYQMIF